MNPLEGADTLYSNYPDVQFLALDTWDATRYYDDADTIDVQTYSRVLRCWRACRSSVESYL